MRSCDFTTAHDLSPNAVGSNTRDVYPSRIFFPLHIVHMTSLMFNQLLCAISGHNRVKYTVVFFPHNYIQL